LTAVSPALKKALKINDDRILAKPGETVEAANYAPRILTVDCLHAARFWPLVAFMQPDSGLYRLNLPSFQPMRLLNELSHRDCGDYPSHSTSSYPQLRSFLLLQLNSRVGAAFSIKVENLPYSPQLDPNSLSITLTFAINTMSLASSSNPVCARADDDSWKFHKDTIYDLYMIQNKTLQDVILEMKSSHNFTAT
jgi:hypothetical protein